MCCIDFRVRRLLSDGCAVISLLFMIFTLFPRSLLELASHFVRSTTRRLVGQARTATAINPKENINNSTQMLRTKSSRYTSSRRNLPLQSLLQRLRRLLNSSHLQQLSRDFSRSSHARSRRQRKREEDERSGLMSRCEWNRDEIDEGGDSERDLEEGHVECSAN